MGDEKQDAAERGRAGKPTVQDVVDAVSGATWNTRNRIMEDLFQDSLQAGDDGLPAFSPPGMPIE